ncbi:MAG: hypothetical protein H5T64_00195 [Chloroflexi bacterium]|nr:hypothetical protein [Chloroflexota bacterium]
MSPTEVGLFMLSAATILFQITLTRIFSVAQGYHFAFMSVSLALLGSGASGSLLTLFPHWVTRVRARESTLGVVALFFSASTLGAYLVMNYIPFDSYRIAWERIQLFYLVLYYLSLTVPFLCGGLIVGLLLAAEQSRVGRVYAVNLIGSALGCFAVVILLPLLGGAGTVVAAALLGALGALAFDWGCLQRTKTGWIYGMALVLVILLAIRPAFLEVRMSPYKTLSQALLYPGTEVVFERWNAFSRVEVVRGAGIRSAPGLSLAYGAPPPPQLGLTIDGDNLTPITRQTLPEDAHFLEYLAPSAAYVLVPKAHALVIEPRGGLDVLVAYQGGAQSIVVVESNPLVVAATRDKFGDYSGSIFRDPRIDFVVADSRSYLARTSATFDVIDLCLVDSYKPVTSGAYSLSENYLYTIESFVECLEHLSENGLLVATRWLQLPPSETLRLWAIALEALERVGVSDPAAHVAAIRSWSTGTVFVKRTPFTQQDIDALRRFCASRKFDLVYYKGMPASEANRYNVLQEPVYYNTFCELVQSEDRREFYRNYPYEISPPTDDRPFFFHFFKWAQTPTILQHLGQFWLPFGGSGYLVLIILLTFAMLASVLLIAGPLLVRQRVVQAGKYRGRFLLYFLLLGLAFFFVEMPLMQRFILLLGQPTYAFAAVLFALLLSSGVGSALSPRLPLRAALGALVALLLVYIAFMPTLFQATLAAPLVVRLMVTIIALCPPGFLMGVAFPSGVRIVGRITPGLVPWVWAVNGCASVISSILAVMLAMSAGFSAVAVAAVLAYGGALCVLWSFADLR